MGIKFYKLMDLLNRKNMTRDDLRKKIGISSATMTKLSKNEYVSLKVIEAICKELNCQPGDIMEYIREDNK